MNFVRAEWQSARVYATVGRPEPSIYHATRGPSSPRRRHAIGGFDLAFAYEGMARAYAVAGDAGEAERWAEWARGRRPPASSMTMTAPAWFLADIESIPNV